MISFDAALGMWHIACGAAGGSLYLLTSSLHIGAIGEEGFAFALGRDVRRSEIEAVVGGPHDPTVRAYLVGVTEF